MVGVHDATWTEEMTSVGMTHFKRRHSTAEMKYVDCQMIILEATTGPASSDNFAKAACSFANLVSSETWWIFCSLSTSDQGCAFARFNKVN